MATKHTRSNDFWRLITTTYVIPDDCYAVQCPECGLLTSVPCEIDAEYAYDLAQNEAVLHWVMAHNPSAA